MKSGLHLTPPTIDEEWKARWPNFTPQELACKCRHRYGYCKGEYFHDPEFMDKLQAMRTRRGKAFIINSGRRCKKYNAIITKNPNSQSMHMKAIAVDISLVGHDRFALLDDALAVGFTGIGTAMTFLHVDNRPTPARWDYGPDSRKYWSQ